MSGIVVGIDGSPNASHALKWAMTEAGLRKADLTVIAVNPVPASHWTGEPLKLPDAKEQVSEVRKSAEDAVSKAAAALGSQQPKSVSVAASSGFPAKTLIDASDKSDLLVVGARGGGGFSALFLGSVSNEVVQQAKCPVVVVPASK